MPVLMTSRPTTSSESKSSALLPQCGNPKCKSGWLRLWRSREVPVFEGKWACSTACVREMIEAAVLRERRDAAIPPATHQHRVPLGLLLLSQGQITQAQLKRALDAQKRAGSGKLGEWLVRQKSTGPEQVVRALAAQWGCPVLSVDAFHAASMAPALPRLLADSFGALPLRVAGRTLLYLAFESRPDPCLALAVERMTGLKCEAGLLRDSEFQRANAALLRAVFPRVRLLEASSLRGAAHAMTAMVEERKPIETRLVRVHNYFWMRLWKEKSFAGSKIPLPGAGDVEDMVCAFSTES
ncbi:MAG: hypothetical protein QJR10_05735 [Bacillota bacterium]|jgi:hypothetical protein|nr:hypothetical protein [Bacillota bacterium]